MYSKTWQQEQRISLVKYLIYIWVWVSLGLQKIPEKLQLVVMNAKQHIVTKQGSFAFPKNLSSMEEKCSPLM